VGDLPRKAWEVGREYPVIEGRLSFLVCNPRDIAKNGHAEKVRAPHHLWQTARPPIPPRQDQHDHMIRPPAGVWGRLGPGVV